jgi:serine/threonine-protein kinase
MIPKSSPLPGLDSKYTLLLELGQGGTAVVYLAVAQGPVGFNKLVVLKALKPSLVNDTEFQRMFLNEARLSARLSHPNIVQVNEVLDDGGLPVIVMEYLAGKPLSELRTRAREELGLAVHLRIIAEVLSGLHYSHELSDYDGTQLGVVHRDMTPHNVMLTYDGSVKILDYGIAKLSGSLVETQTGAVKGKLRYMPPEQIAGEHVDRRADIYSVGVMLWEAATGKRMWADLAEPVVMNRVLNGHIPRPSEERAVVAPELERIVMRALARERSDRYATAADLQTELDAFLATLEPATSRDIGALVAKAFAEERDEARRLVDERLSQLSLSSAEKYASFSVHPGPAEPTQTATSRTERSTITRTLQASGTGFRIWAAVTFVSISVVLAALLAASARRGDETAVLDAGPARALDAAREAPLATVELGVTAYPISAKLYVDDQPVAGNPYRASVPRSSAGHTVRAEADGYLSASRPISLERDQDIVLVLQRAEQADSGSPAAPPKKRPAAAAKPPSQKDLCDPPYIVQDGIKKFKPGCLR